MLKHQERVEWLWHEQGREKQHLGEDVSACQHCAAALGSVARADLHLNVIAALWVFTLQRHPVAPGSLEGAHCNEWHW